MPDSPHDHRYWRCAELVADWIIRDHDQNGQRADGLTACMIATRPGGTVDITFRVSGSFSHSLAETFQPKGSRLSPSS